LRVVGYAGVIERRSESILWSFLAAALAAWVVAFPLTNTDIWWHLAGGRAILEHGLVDRDPFSVSARDAPWVNIHWAFQIAAFAVWSWGGVLALVLAKAATVALGAAVLIAATRPWARGLAVLVLVVALFAVRHLVMARPIVVTLLFLAGFTWGLERYRRHRRWRALLGLPVLQILWVNMQGLHVLGPVLVLCYLTGAGIHRSLEGRWSMPWRPLVAAVGAVAIASLANPYGASAALLPWKLLARIDPNVTNVFSVHVAEFVPPWHLERTSPGTFLHLSLFLALLALSFLWSRHRVVWPHVAVVFAFTALALMAHRNLLLLYWLAAPILAANLARGSLRLPRGLLPAAIAVVAAIVVAARTGRLDRPAPFRVPQLSTELLAGQPGGNLFCSVRYGGYLAWSLHPAWAPYIDGRLVLRTGEQFVEYLEVLEQPSRFDDLHHRFAFDAVVLPTALPERYLPLAAYLIQHPHWVLAHTDGTEVLLLPRAAGSRSSQWIGAAPQMRWPTCAGSSLSTPMTLALASYSADSKRRRDEAESDCSVPYRST
jgi:hypothetical protein